MGNGFGMAIQKHHVDDLRLLPLRRNPKDYKDGEHQPQNWPGQFIGTDRSVPLLSRYDPLSSSLVLCALCVSA